jgi:ABC-type polysaccharide/polyol phosphate transport system ATPase subunit
VLLDHATRTFDVRAEHGRTLKEVFVRRGRRASAMAVPALQDVNVRIAPGEAVGLVGRNGAGKTSTLSCLAGIVPLDSGTAACGGRVVTLLELGAGFGADFSGRENVYLNGALHGFGRQEIDDRIEEIVDFSELGEFIDLPVKTYSAGMFLRLGFSVAAFLDADVMLIDEILAVGDASFQRKCLARIAARMDAGATLVLVSHDPTAIERVCRRVVVLDHGSVAFDGDVADGLLHHHRLLGTDRGTGRMLRSGDGSAVEVRELVLSDSEGRERSIYRPGEALRVAMRLGLAAEVDRVGIALEVRGERGELCFRTETTMNAPAEGDQVTFEVPHLGLLGGDYDIRVGVNPQDVPSSESLDRLVRFSVSDVLGGEGIADLRGHWAVAGQRRSEEALR